MSVRATARRRAVRALLAVLSVAVAVAACSSGGTNNGGGKNSGSGKGGNTSAAPAAPTKLTAAQIDWAAKYIGGTRGAAKSSLAPVVVGYVNQQGGTLAFPEATVALDATVRFINKQLGGVGGHPLVVHKCLAASTDDVLKCGTQMANDPAVKSIVIPLLLLNNQAFYNAIGGKKPILDGTLIFPIDFTTPNVYSYYAGGEANSKALATFALKILKGKRVVFLRTDNPAGLAAVQSEIAAVKALGGETKDIPVSEPGTAPAYTAAIRAAGLQDGDIVNLSLTSIGCSTAYDALRNVPVKVSVTAAEICLLPPMPGHLKDLGLDDTVFPDGWYMSTQGYTAAMPAPNSNGADVYVAMMHQYAPKAPSLYGEAPLAFSELMTMAKFMGQAGATAATPAKLAQLMKSFTGPAALEAGAIKCGAEPKAPNQCNFTLGYEQRKDGKWVSIADGLNGKAIDTLNS